MYFGVQEGPDLSKNKIKNYKTNTSNKHGSLDKDTISPTDLNLNVNCKILDLLRST